MSHAQHTLHENDAEDIFVHPFLTHMGLPDEPDEVSLRITGFTTGHETEIETDLAVHIEATLLKNVGLHIRSDGIQHEDYSEVMLQYAVLRDKEMHNGISLFGQLSIPTGPVGNGTYKGLFGASGRFTISGITVVDGNIHYDPGDKMAEYESAFVFRASDKFYPIVEIRGHIGGHETEVYLLPAIKFKTGEHSAFGVGIQVALSRHREYDSQALFTYDITF